MYVKGQLFGAKIEISIFEFLLGAQLRSCAAKFLLFQGNRRNI
jgi:hypothetical protein